MNQVARFLGISLIRNLGTAIAAALGLLGAPTWSGRSALTASLVDAKTPDLGVRHHRKLNWGIEGEWIWKRKTTTSLQKLLGELWVRHVPSWRPWGLFFIFLVVAVNL